MPSVEVRRVVLTAAPHSLGGAVCVVEEVRAVEVDAPLLRHRAAAPGVDHISELWDVERAPRDLDLVRPALARRR